MLRAQTLEERGNLSFMRQQPHDAETYWRSALEVLASYNMEQTPLGATLQYNRAITYGARGEVAKELEQLRALSPLFESTFAPQHPMMMTFQTEMSWALSMTADDDGALEWGLRSLETAERVYGKDHYELANSLGSVALLYGNLYQFEKAAPYVERAVAVTRHGLGPHHTSTGLAHQQLAYVYIHQDRLDAAQAQLDAARVALWTALPADTHQLHADWYFANGGLQDKLGNLEESADYFKKSWELYESLLGNNHFLVSDATTQLARIRGKQGRYEEAKSLYEIGVPIILDLRGQTAPSVVRETRRWADILDKLELTDEAAALRAKLPD